MNSILNGINKKDAKTLLIALREYSQAYYAYKDGKPYDHYKDLNLEEVDNIMELTVKLADKIGLDEEAGF